MFSFDGPRPNSEQTTSSRRTATYTIGSAYLATVTKAFS